MRTGVRKQLLLAGRAGRASGDRRSAFAHLASYLLCLLLVLQTSVAAHHLGHAAAAPSPEATALASLGAAVGQPVALCEHDPSRPYDPAGPASCEHCIFCHSAAVGFAPDLSSSAAAARVSTVTPRSRPAADIAYVRKRYAGNSTPRGPPALA